MKPLVSNFRKFQINESLESARNIFERGGRALPLQITHRIFWAGLLFNSFEIEELEAGGPVLLPSLQEQTGCDFLLPSFKSQTRATMTLVANINNDECFD
jgi:hypothetical protein